MDDFFYLEKEVYYNCDFDSFKYLYAILASLLLLFLANLLSLYFSF